MTKEKKEILINFSIDAKKSISFFGVGIEPKECIEAYEDLKLKPGLFEYKRIYRNNEYIENGAVAYGVFLKNCNDPELELLSKSVFSDLSYYSTYHPEVVDFLKQKGFCIFCARKQQ